MAFWKRERTEPEGDVFLVVGLGNPGPRFERTRHNVGFMVANELARRAGASFKSTKQRADVAKATVDDRSLLIAQPQTYMNESGAAVSRLVQYYHVPLSRLMVVCDDLDLPFGTLRLRPSGSSGGQNGLRSIIAQLGTQEFARLRIGVGRPRGDAVDHVLSRFPPDQEGLLPRLVDVAADATVAGLGDMRAAMNQYNRDWLPDLATSPSAP